MTAILLGLLATQLHAQDTFVIPGPGSGDRIPEIETCGEFQALRADDSEAAIRYALTLAAGYVRGLERAGIIDDLLPIPPELSGMPTQRPDRERTLFLFSRFLISCGSHPDKTTQEALDSALAQGRTEFEALLRRRDSLDRWLRWRQEEGCVPETGEGCDLIRLL